MHKRPTLADVARRSGLSKTAVSLALNDRPGSRLSAEAIQRVRDAAQELGYRPNPAAQTLRLGTTRTVGFISDNVAVTRYASAMIRGALDVAEELDHAVLIAETGSKPARIRKALELMVDRRTDAIIFGAMSARELDLPPAPPGLPVVFLNALSNWSDTPVGTAVLPDERIAGYAVARLLLDQGHRDGIALIGSHPAAETDRSISVTIGDRFRGIRSAMTEAGSEFVALAPIQDWAPQNGYAATRDLLRGHRNDPRITALLCLNDNLAFGAYQAAQEAGLTIPGDISIVSFDDDEIAEYMRPGLTTARIPYEEMGRAAMRLALEPEAEGHVHLVPMPIQLRESIGPAHSHTTG